MYIYVYVLRIYRALFRIYRLIGLLYGHTWLFCRFQLELRDSSDPGLAMYIYIYAYVYICMFLMCIYM